MEILDRLRRLQIETPSWGYGNSGTRFHVYPWPGAARNVHERIADAALVHKLTYRRHNHDNMHVRGYQEEGTTTTPFDMVVLNNLDRYQLALDAIRRIPRLQDQVEVATQRYWTTMERHKLYISEHGQDMPEVENWHWVP